MLRHLLPGNSRPHPAAFIACCRCANTCCMLLLAVSCRCSSCCHNCTQPLLNSMVSPIRISCRCAKACCVLLRAVSCHCSSATIAATVCSLAKHLPSCFCCCRCVKACCVLLLAVSCRCSSCCHSYSQHLAMGRAHQSGRLAQSRTGAFRV
jgi:hypothetical protein